MFQDISSANLLQRDLSELGYPESGDRILLLEKYYQNLVEWNSFMNLTTITEREDVYKKHFLDSLSFIKAVENRTAGEETTKGTEKGGKNEVLTGKLIDIGTGAGFPGLPIAIFYPRLQVILMDSLAKRLRFLDDTINKLGITNVELIHSRAEDLARKPEHREQYDYCCSRAVAKLSTLSEYCLPFVKIGGLFLSYKAEKAEQELNAGKKAAEILGGTIEEPISFVLPGTDYKRVLIPIKKTGKTPKKYPRKAGVPAKEPIS